MICQTKRLKRNWKKPIHDRDLKLYSILTVCVVILKLRPEPFDRLNKLSFPENVTRPSLRYLVLGGQRTPTTRNPSGFFVMLWSSDDFSHTRCRRYDRERGRSRKPRAAEGDWTVADRLNPSKSTTPRSGSDTRNRRRRDVTTSRRRHELITDVDRPSSRPLGVYRQNARRPRNGRSS